LAAEWNRTIHENQPYDTEFRFVDAAGQTHWAKASAAAIQGGDGEIVGYVGTITDISETKISERKLHDANEAMQVWVTELEQRTREISRLNELSSLLESCLTAQEAYGLLQEMGAQLFPRQVGLLGVINPSRNMVEAVLSWGAGASTDTAFPPEDCWALRRGRAHWYEAGTGAVRCPHLGGAEPNTSLCVPMMAHGEALGVLHLQGLPASGRSFAQTVADNISLALANLNLRERLRDQSIRDVLTGLFNRRYLEETLERELKRAERENAPVGVLMLDLDNFKRFNDSFGHAAGDEVMRVLGRMLGRQVRVEDIACRYGGEEFTLVLPGCSLEAACERAEILCRDVRDMRVPFAGQVLGGVTLSVGVAAYPQHGATGSVVMRAADAALYQAKLAGRDRVMPAGMAHEQRAQPVDTDAGPRPA
jgi:diguanylate cyclase (GGDEF)-like protein